MKYIFLPIIFLVFFTHLGCMTAETSAEDALGIDYSDQEGYTIRNVNMVEVESGEVHKNTSVWVIGEKIQKIDKGSKMEIPESFRIINGNGKFLVPGIAEMHAHIPFPREMESEDLVEETLFLYLSNGITTIRGMLGNPYHLTLKEKVSNGEMLSPRIYTSGPSLNGNSVPNDSVAIKSVREQAKSGYDFLKLHPGLKRSVFDAIVKTAKEENIPYAGHVSVDVGIEHAIASDYASVDHLDGYLEGLVSPSEDQNPESNGFFGFNFIDFADLSRLPDLAKATAEANVAVVPTQSLMVRLSSLKTPEEMAQEPEMKYMSKRTVNQWKQSKFGFQGAENYNSERVEAFISLRNQILISLRDADVLILLGSDAPQIFNVPGFSIQHEMKFMADAGMTPLEILRSGTVNPAKYFGESDHMGSIAVGKSADLILLNENPLEDIANMKNPEGVMVRGTWLSKKMIQDRLFQIEARHAKTATE